MSGIAAIIEELVLSAIISEKVLPQRKSKMDWGLAALSILLAGGELFFLALALDRHLETLYADDIAALISGLAILGTSFASAALAWHINSKKRLNISSARAEFSKNVKGLLQVVCDELDEPVRENPKAAMVLALVSGFLAANHRSR